MRRDPFADRDSPYVPSPSHDEAVARLVYAIENSDRRVLFTAAAGLGKTTVLRKAFEEVRSPRRRLASVSCPRDGTLLFGGLAERLGVRAGKHAPRIGTWKALERAVRVSSLEGVQVVLAIDECHEIDSDATRRDHEWLHQLGSDWGIAPTIIRVAREAPDVRSDSVGAWTLAIGLKPLTRSQADGFVRAKLETAGCGETLFTPRAITRIHHLSEGVPRGLDRLASLSLVAGAVRGLEVITPDVIDAAARECRGLDWGYLAPGQSEQPKSLP